LPGRSDFTVTPRIPFLLLLFFLSGAAALVYEVLWLKELGRLFGVTSHAAATTLAAFFTGLAAGSMAWGGRAAHLRNPLRMYSLLEIGIALSALLYFLLLDAYRWIQSPLFQLIRGHPPLSLLVKFLLGLGILFPAAFFMGGTLPVMAQFLVRRRDELGIRASLLYGINTIGAAVGAFASGFLLPRYLGFRGSYFVAIASNLCIALIAWRWSRSTLEMGPAEPRAAAIARPSSLPADDARRSWSPADEARPSRPPAVAARPPWPPVGPGRIGMVAFASGFLTLALEVLWTRMYAQVLQNSVYTFATILTVFLAALAAGAGFANFLCRRPWPPQTVLCGLALVSGVLVGLTPLGFYRSTGALTMIGGDLGWTAYIVRAFLGVGLVLLVPVIAVGSVFPYAMKLGEAGMKSAGGTIGRLLAINTAAAILGSLAAGFVLLEAFGLWTSIRLAALAYLGLGLLLLPRGTARLALGGAALVAAGLFAGVLTYSDLAKAQVDAARNETLVQVWEGSDGTVAVVRRGDDLRMKVNNSYVLGTSQSEMNLRLQSYIPLALHPDPRRVFYLGMGTGITAGGALDFPVERVVICEVDADIVRAARAHFRPYVNGIFDDPRVEIVVEDGRTYLSAVNETFDAVISDIFLTYKAGVGNLYTKEHFEAARSRLAPGGCFVQWLTLFDLTAGELGIIARTMLDVFPQVTLWRRGFSPSFPVFALIGRLDPAPLDDTVLERWLAHLRERGALPRDVWIQNVPHAAYAGNLTAARKLFERYEVGTDDRIPLEYLAPITERESKGARKRPVLAWLDLAEFCETLLHAAPPAGDPYLTTVSDVEKDHVLAGLAFYRSATYERMNRAREAEAYRQQYQRLLHDAAPTPAAQTRSDSPADAF
jgi:spermidine synthase